MTTYAQQQATEICRLRSDNEQLRDILSNVMGMIEDWDPSFVYEEEWEAVRSAVRAILHPRKSGD